MRNQCLVHMNNNNDKFLPNLIYVRVSVYVFSRVDYD